MGHVVAATLVVGQHVVAIDIGGRVYAAEIARIPQRWRDASGNEAVTSRGDFAKAWLRFRDCGITIPWPVEDVFTDLDVAKTAAVDRDAARAAARVTRQ